MIIREEWTTGWVNNSPALTYLADNRWFIWESERNGWSNFYLYDPLPSTLITPLTSYTTLDVGSLVKVDERAGVVFYTARDRDNHLKMRLHRVGLDGKGDVRLTDPAFNRTAGSCLAGGTQRFGPGGQAGRCGISPDSTSFVDVYQTHEVAPATRLVDARTGRMIAELAKSDVSRFRRSA